MWLSGFFFFTSKVCCPHISPFCPRRPVPSFPRPDTPAESCVCPLGVASFFLVAGPFLVFLFFFPPFSSPFFFFFLFSRDQS